MNAYLRKTMMIILVFIISGVSSAQASLTKIINDQPTSGVDTAYPAESWKTDFISNTDSAGSAASMAFDPDHAQTPWVSYHDETNGSLWVAHYVGNDRGNCGSKNKWTCEQVDLSGNYEIAYSTSIDIFPDINPSPLVTTWKVGISYYDAIHQSLKYAVYKCSIISPCAWTINTVDSSPYSSDHVGRHSSMKFNRDGIPYIAYDSDYLAEVIPIGYLRRAYYDPTTGNCGDNNSWNCTTIDSSILGYDFHPSLDFNYFNQDYIAYTHYYLSNNLVYRDLYQTWPLSNGGGQCGPDHDWECYEIVHTNGVDIGLFPSVHAVKSIHDYYRVAYYDSTNGKLDYVYNVNETEGNCGFGNRWKCSEIDDIGIDRQQVSISLDVDNNFVPMVAYSDASEDGLSPELKVAEPRIAGNCGPTIIFPTNVILHTWWCGLLDGGTKFILTAGFVSLGINADGKAMIAYSEYQYYSAEYSLKFAYQPEHVFLPLTER